MSFVPLKNNLGTIGINFLFDFVSPIIKSNTINTFLYLLNYVLPNFHKQHQFLPKNQ